MSHTGCFIREAAVETELHDAAVYLPERFAYSPGDVGAHWIVVERDVEAGERHLVVGPYRGARAANEAMIDSLLMDSLAEESCLDMFAVPHAGLDSIELSDHELVLIDKNEPAHHARSRGPSST